MKTYHVLSDRRKEAYRRARFLIPKKTRLFFEGSIDVPGQLWFADRKLIYNRILKHKPECVFEVGTWLGGGSTLIIASALAKNGFGKLHTIEADHQIYQEAVENYSRYLQHLKPFVELHYGVSTDVYPAVLEGVKAVNFLFMDGSNDPQQTTDEYNMFKPFLKKGSILVAHDWDDEKMMALKPLISSSSDWSIEEVLTMPKSVGLAACRYLAGE